MDNLDKLNPNLMLFAALAVGGLYLLHRVKGAAADAANAVNPVNPDNVFYSGVNAVGGAITGDESWTLGGQVYDWVNGTRSATRDELRAPGTSGN